MRFTTQQSKKLRLLTLTQVLHFGAGFYAFTLLFVKAAILLQWIRLFAPNGTRGPFFVGRFDIGPKLQIALLISWGCSHLVGLPDPIMVQHPVLYFDHSCR